MRSINSADRITEMYKVIETLINITSPWLYLLVSLMAFSMILWKVIMWQVRKRSDRVSQIFMFVIYMAVFLGEKGMFILVARKQPCFDFGFYGSVVVPTVGFYLFLALTIIFAIRALRCSFLTPMSLLQFVPGMYFITIVQFMYAMALSSPTGMFMAFLAFIMAGWAGLSIPLEIERKEKQKQD